MPGISPRLTLSVVFKCYVCLQPINPRPEKNLPIDPVEAYRKLRDGIVPEHCISCGRRFRPSKRIVDQYLDFLSMHVPEVTQRDELSLMLLARQLRRHRNRHKEA